MGVPKPIPAPRQNLGFFCQQLGFGVKAKMSFGGGLGTAQNPENVDKRHNRIYPYRGINQSVLSLLSRENNLDFRWSQSNGENALVGNYSHVGNDSHVGNPQCWSPNKCLGQDEDPRG